MPRPDSCDETSCRVPTLQASALKKIGVDPPPAAYATQGGFWFVSQLLARVFAASWSHAPQILCLSRPRHLLRPNDATRRRVGRRAEAAGLRRAPRPLLGIHVRRGDSCREVQEATKARRCSPFAEYWYHALAMRARGGVQAFISVARSSPQARYGIRSVFLATDDPSVVDEARIAATAADLPLYAMLANPPASAGTAPPPLWDSARARVGLSLHDPC